LRLAACAVDRPGHLLLIQSLERAFWAMAERVLPHLNSQAVQEWALCALYALGERNAQELRRELPPLLQACDERVLGGLAPWRLIRVSAGEGGAVGRGFAGVV